MTLALPALVLALALLPGWLARSRIRHIEGHGRDHTPLAQAWAEALLWAGVLHAGLLGLGSLSGVPLVPAGVVLKLLSPEPAVQTGALAALGAQASGIAAYGAVLVAIAHFGPSIARRLIVRHRLDRRGARFGALLRPSRASWYYLLSGADFAADALPDLVVVTTVVDVAGQPWLYKGILDEYFIDRDGQLERLILQQVVRRPLATGQPAAASARPQDRFEPVEGDCVVLRYSEISTLQVEYIRLNRAAELPPHLPPPAADADAFAPTQPV
jgi:hypothetical protein